MDSAINVATNQMAKDGGETWIKEVKPSEPEISKPPIEIKITRASTEQDTEAHIAKFLINDKILVYIELAKHPQNNLWSIADITTNKKYSAKGDLEKHSANNDFAKMASDLGVCDKKFCRIVIAKVIQELEKINLSKPQDSIETSQKEEPEDISFQFFEKDSYGHSVFISKLLGDYIIDETSLKTLKSTDKIYRYENGIYKDDGETFIKRRCKEILFKKYSNRRINEVLSYIRASTYIEHNQNNSHIINLKNGILDPITMEFMGHTPEVFSISQIPIDYDPKASCPLWEQKLSEKVDKQTMDVLQEMFGYVFMPGQKHEVAFLFHGPQRTMKSTVLYVLCQLMGEDNITAFPLQQLNDDNFSMAYLFGKMANVCADLDSYSLKSTGKFMQIVGGDKITAGKKHEHYMSFYPSAKLIFSCNIIPGTTNKDLAFYRRWVILPFEKQTPEADIDPNMKEKLVAELAGILNWALMGLKRLQEQNKFSYWLNTEQIKDLYEKASDSINSYIYNRINCEDDEESLTKREVYADYTKYCKENHLNKENPIKFGRVFLGTTGCGTRKKGIIPAYAGVWWKG